MDPLTLMLLGTIGGAFIGGLSATAQAGEENKKLESQNKQLSEQQRLLEENKKALLTNLSTYLGGLQQRDLQYQNATQLAIQERRTQNAKDMAQTLLSTGEAGLGRSSTTTRLAALNQIDTAKDIGIRKTNLENLLMQSYLNRQQQVAKTKTDINSLGAQQSTIQRQIASNLQREDNNFLDPLFGTLEGALKGLTIFL